MLKGRKNLGQSPIIFKSGAPVSVVCVAATFTTLTYADNGGKVQLSSTGAHGLTTSPAVGASVYVSWADGTGVSGLYNVKSVDDILKITIEYPYAVGLGTPTVAVATTAITVGSCLIPALLPNSQIKMHTRCQTTYTATSKELRITYGGQGVAYKQTSVATLTIAIASVISNNNSTAAQTCNGALPLEGVSGGAGFTARTINSAIPQTMGIAVVPGVANDPMMLKSYIVEVFI